MTLHDAVWFVALAMLFLIGKAWEAGKVNLRSVDDDCGCDMSALRKAPLQVTMDAMDEARRQQNDGEDEVRCATVNKTASRS